ncbi:retrovirus-related pol polyprotein from transposon TNT 1-94 [Tanacetum coccineum]
MLGLLDVHWSLKLTRFHLWISTYIQMIKSRWVVFKLFIVMQLWDKFLNENEQLLEQVISKDIVNIIVNSSVDNASVNVHECEKCLKLETELLNKKDFIEKETYDKLFRSYNTLEKHCISLEVDTQLNQEIFQRDNSVSNQSALSFDQYFELNELKAQSQEKYTVIKKLKERIKSLSGNMNEDKIKKDIEEIETINIELDHRVSKLIAENEHLKQTYKQLYDSIKPTRIRSKEQCDALINQVNQKSVEISDLNASLQEKVMVITDLKNELRKLKGKDLADNVVTKNTIDPAMLKIDVEPIAPRLLNNRTAHSDYLRHTQEQAAILREIVEQGKSQNPLNNSLDSAYLETQQESGLPNIGYTWRPTGRTFTIVGNACPLTRITTTAEVPLRKPTTLESDTPKPVRVQTICYTLSLGDMMASSPICLLSKASKTKSWLWHRRPSHLNFGAINHLARHGLVRGLPMLKFEKDHLCVACVMGKSKKKSHKPKSEDTNQEKLYLLHMDLCGPMRVASVNGKKYILIIVDDYSRFTWIKYLMSKYEAPDFIIKFLKMIQVRLKTLPCSI